MRVPVALGANVMLRTQLASPASFAGAAGQLSELTLKSAAFAPPIASLASVIAAVAVFVILAFSGGSVTRDKLFLYSVANHDWSEIAAPASDDLFWSADSRFLYFMSLDAEKCRINRMNVTLRRIALVLEFARFAGIREHLAGVTPDGQIILQQHAVTSDVYQLELDWP